MLSSYCRTQNTLFRFICSAEDRFSLTSNKFRMVYKVDGNRQLDSRDCSMYSNILNRKHESFRSEMNSLSLATVKESFDASSLRSRATVSLFHKFDVTDSSR